MHAHTADATTIVEELENHSIEEENVFKSSTANPLQASPIERFEVSEVENVSDEYCVFLDPWHRDNIGIFSSYLAVGFSMYFILTPLNFYMIDVLDATPGEQSIIIGLTNLPWALKMFCGFITDSYPIYGLRRKPYLLGGWLLYCLCNLVLAVVVKPNLAVLALFIFLQTWAFIQADVCTDAMIVERSKKYENDLNRGTLQATGYITRFIGAIFGAIMGAVLYNKDDWGWG
jgi:MFS family permease